MKPSIFRLRGVGSGRVCPRCGGDSMRTEGGMMNRMLRRMGLRIRWCRACRAEFVAPLKVPPLE
ncbi:hypothetical protein [Longimicrobium terrae]|nr:hypothetical protein [Longimicrobium terrae]MBB4634413.1 hypothetical protein [Longimicrobium terrae]NNC27883.1 hypothetical protein [Longimicrobium terrae]